MRLPCRQTERFREELPQNILGCAKAVRLCLAQLYDLPVTDLIIAGCRIELVVYRYVHSRLHSGSMRSSDRRQRVDDGGRLRGGAHRSAADNFAL